MKGIRRNPLTITLAAVVCGLALRADADRLNLASEWAGSYGYVVPNSTMSFQLVISPGSRFNLSMGGCFGRSEVSHGSVAYRDGFLMFDPGPSAEPGFPLDSNAFIPIRRDGRNYLVGTQRVWSLAQAVQATAGVCSGDCPSVFTQESSWD